TVMAKMRTRRKSLNKAALEPIDGGAQPLELGGEAFELVASDKSIVAQRLCHALRGIGLPPCERAHGAADALGGDVAHKAREFFLEIPAQVLRQIAQLVGEFALAGNAFQHYGRARLIAAGLDAPVGGDDDPHGRKKRRPKLGRLPDEMRETLARPAFAREELVQQ